VSVSNVDIVRPGRVLPKSGELALRGFDGSASSVINGSERRINTALGKEEDFFGVWHTVPEFLRSPREESKFVEIEAQLADVYGHPLTFFGSSIVGCHCSLDHYVVVDPIKEQSE
jgi:hypothetical protein